jgi:transposase-like protein
MRKLLKKYGFVPDKLITDDLRSYAAAASVCQKAKSKLNDDEVHRGPHVI